MSEVVPVAVKAIEMFGKQDEPHFVLSSLSGSPKSISWFLYPQGLTVPQALSGLFFFLRGFWKIASKSTNSDQLYTTHVPVVPSTAPSLDGRLLFPRIARIKSKIDN